MPDLMQSSVTYSSTGQTHPVGAGSLDPSVMALGMGGTRLFAIYAAYQQLQALKSNLTIATNYYNINKQDFDFWNTTYNPKMVAALSEAMGRQFYSAGTYMPQYGALDYISSTGRGMSRASMKYDKEWFNARRRVGKYNVGQGHRVDLKYALGRFNAELEGWNLGFRYEDHRKIVYDEQRHAHQAEILNLGIGAGNAARAGLATAVRGLSDAKVQKANILGSFSNGLSTFAGYLNTTQGVEQQRSARRAFSGAHAEGLATNTNDKIFSSGF